MAFSLDIQHKITALAGRIRAGLENCGDNPTAAPLLDALEQGRFSFLREPWYDISASPSDARPAEFLLRARDENAAPLSLAAPIAEIYQNGFYALFDSAITLAAVDRALEGSDAEKGLPVSINISTRNAGDYDALTGLHHVLQAGFKDRYRPDQVIFELLEDDRAAVISDAAMGFMIAQGYRFALDDMTDSAFDAERLNNLGPYASFVKIDGRIVSAARNNPAPLIQVLDRAEIFAPKARIICEWIDSAEEAGRFRRMFPRIGLVQGRNLGHDAQDFSRRFDQAAKNGPQYPGPSFRAG